MAFPGSGTPNKTVVEKATDIASEAVGSDSSAVVAERFDGMPSSSTNKATDGDANSRSLLVYLDHSDLVNIADGRAVDVDALRHALDVSGAHLLISPVHLIDLGESEPSTKQRWIAATARLAPLRFATEPGVDIALDLDGLAKIVADSTSDICMVRSVAMMKQQAEDASRNASLGDARPGLSPKQIRKIAEAMLTGNHDQFAHLDNAIVQPILATVAPLRSMLETQNFDKAAVLASLFPNVEDAVVAGNLSDVVRLRRRLNLKRMPQVSDTADEWHLRFAIHADVFTVDGNVAHESRSIEGRRLPIRGRRAGINDDRVYVYRCGKLASVAKAVLALSGKTT